MYIKLLDRHIYYRYLVLKKEENVMKLIDTFPTHTIKNLSYRAGRVFPFGASLIGDAVNFSIFSKEAVSCSLLLFHHGQKKPFLTDPFVPRKDFCMTGTRSFWTLTRRPSRAEVYGAGNRIPTTRFRTGDRLCRHPP